MENENQDVNLQNDTEETVNFNEESVEATETEETGAEVDVETEVKRQTAVLYARMKQAEADAKKAKAELANSSRSETKVSGELGTTDVIYLAKADIHDDDMDEVLKHAKLHNVSVKEAHSYLKPILDVRLEQRKTAEASNVGSSKRGSGKISDEVLLSKASKGEISGNDADIERLIEARFQAKKGK